MSWSSLILVLIGAVILAGSILGVREARSKHILTWLGSYLRQRGVRADLRKRLRAETAVHFLFCMVDHFEPIRSGSSPEQIRARLHAWVENYPKLAGRHKDSYGRPVQHTWFYPAEEYDPEMLDGLVNLCSQGFGEIELHLHHGHDTVESLRTKFLSGIQHFAKHNALVTQEVPPRHAYGFIHGNMALANSRFDPEYCGVNDEIRILKETGCYADFSLPTAPCISQPAKVNTIYYATSDGRRPKSHNWGVDVEVGGKPTGDLMMIPGPLGFNWSSRKWGLVPRIENGEVQSSNPPTLSRVQNWVRQNVHVKGRPEWVVVKVSCHGAEDQNRDVMLGNSADNMYLYLEKECRDRPAHSLHYVTARELYNIIKAAEAGKSGDPDLYRDFAIFPYRTHGK